MQRRFVHAIALAVMLVTAGCSGIVNTTGTVPQDTGSAGNIDTAGAAAPSTMSGQPARTIEVVATGNVQTQPDEAVIRVAVTTTGENASVVRTRLAENASRMREALAAMGIGSDRITTTDYDIGRNYRAERDDSAPPFIGRHAFTITVTDLNQTGAVIVTAVENGATDVNDVRFTLSEERRGELRNQALGEAMDTAEDRATVIAERADLGMAGVHTVRTADVGFRPIRFEGQALAAAGAPTPTTIESGSVTVTARVEVVYNASG